MDSRDPKGLLNEELRDRLNPRSSLISMALIRAERGGRQPGRVGLGLADGLEPM